MSVDIDALLAVLDPEDLEALRARVAGPDDEPDDDPDDDELVEPDDEPVPAVRPFTPVDTTPDHATWDAYWAAIEAKRAAEQGAAATTVIRGVTVQVPTSLPMRVDRDIERMSASTDLADIQALLVTLFGSDVLDAWIDAGMHEDEFRVALLWALSHGKGRGLTFAQAHEAVMSEGESLRAAPANRAERRAGNRPATGGKRKNGKRRTR